jgi:hypothetical protein
MSPRTYGFLWIIVIAAAGIMWLAGVLTLVAVVVFGFIAFGMTFVGMMCVLPGVYSHPPAAPVEKPAAKIRPQRAKASISTSRPVIRLARGHS